MNWAWAASLEHLWRSPGFPMWLTLAAAGFFGIIVLITLLRADRSVANGTLAVITLLAVGVAAAASIRSFGPGGRETSAGPQSPPPTMASLPALSCIDDIAGEAVLTACEKALFASPESAAAALSYAAAQITRLIAFGDVAAANKNLTPDLQILRRAVERDRYGLMAYVLQARDRCTPTDCAAFRALTNRQKIAVNMDERTYDGLIARYAPLWNAPPATTAPATATPLAALAPTMPTGKPTNAEFPTAASTPAVSIMTPEPGTAPSSAPRSPPTSSQASAPAPSTRPASAAAAAPAAAKKQAAAKSSRAAAPVQLAPEAPAPAAAND